MLSGSSRSPVADQPTFLFAGGGTGGHLFPALAVVEHLAAACPRAKALFACTDKAIDRRVLEPAGCGYVVQPVRPIPSNPLAWPGFLMTWRRSLALARKLIDDVRPAAVLGLGGYAAGPVVRVAAARGIRCGLLNPDAIPGKANQYLAGRAERIFTQFASTADCFPASVREKVAPVGCPVRPSLLGADRERSRAELGLRGDRKTLVVMGGSLGAETVNEAVLACADLLAKRAETWQVLHIAGPGKAERARAAYQAGRLSAVVLEFCDHMGAAYAAADLLIGRAGANTVAELTATGTPGVLLPYPFHRDQHQRHNAAEMAAAGAAVVIDDAADPAVNAARLGEALRPLLDDDARLAAMAVAAAELGRPAAAAAVAQWLIEAESP